VPTQVIVAPVDDGKVEIMYGATARRELYKYGGPAATKFQQLPAQASSVSTEVVEQSETAESSSAESGSTCK